MSPIKIRNSPNVLFCRKGLFLKYRMAAYMEIAARMILIKVNEINGKTSNTVTP